MVELEGDLRIAKKNIDDLHKQMVTSPPKEMCVSFIATGPVTG